MSARRRPDLWRAPLALGAFSAVGLISALLGDGPWDVLAWLALGAPVAIAALCWLRRERA